MKSETLYKAPATQDQLHYKHYGTEKIPDTDFILMLSSDCYDSLCHLFYIAGEFSERYAASLKQEADIQTSVDALKEDFFTLIGLHQQGDHALQGTVDLIQVAEYEDVSL